MPAKVINIRNISKTFGRVHAVCNLSFAVEEGTCFGFVGPNGAGKTTMMKMLYAKSVRDRNCNGTMDVFGFDPREHELEIKYLSGVVPQENNLDEELNVVQNLMIYSRFYGIASSEAGDRIDYLLDFLELSEKRSSSIRELSGGMKRRLIIARALINNPRLLILDEPTTGLDPQVRHLIWDKLGQLKKAGTTILLTTHYMEEAFANCDRLLIMHQGRKVMQGTPHDLLSKNTEPYVLELPSSEYVKIRDRCLSGGVRIDESHETARLFSEDMDALKAVAEVLEVGCFHLRHANLEDVFLRATGRKLNDRQ
jgi:lipooligosaccharide transport system ATP-binding protein